MTLLHDPRPISADSHALEGPGVFEGLAEHFGDDAPRVVHKEGKGDFIVTPNMPKRSRTVAIMALAGTRLDYAEPLPRAHPVQLPEVATAELERAIDLGFKGIVIPSNAPRGRRYCDPEYDALWARAEEAGLPVAFHVACMSHVPDWMKAMKGRDPIAEYAGSAMLIHDTLIELMVRGVCAKFPKLRFVLAEFNAGWVAHWLDKVEQGWAREHTKDPSSAPPANVLDIWKRQFYATIEDDAAALRTRDLIGEETLL